MPLFKMLGNRAVATLAFDFDNAPMMLQGFVVDAGQLYDMRTDMKVRYI